MVRNATFGSVRVITALSPIVLAWLNTVVPRGAEAARALDDRRAGFGASLATFVTVIRPSRTDDDVGEGAADVDAEHQGSGLRAISATPAERS